MYLNCRTYFSLRYGTYSTEELVNTAAEHNIHVLALTNINCTCDSWDFVNFCKQKDIKPVVGVEIRNEDELLYILIARNNRGFACINEFLSSHLQHKIKFPDHATAYFQNSHDVYIIYPFDRKAPGDLLPGEYIGILAAELNKLFGTDWKKFEHKLVVRQPITFQNKQYFNLHRLLRAIDKNTLLSKLPVEAQASPDETFISPAALLEQFRQFPAIVTNTYKLLDTCSIDMDFKVDKNKKCFSATAEDDRVLLEKLATEGLMARYGRKNKVAQARLQKELKIINDLGFNSYFLINWDVIWYAQSRGFYYVGRGSGANSIVAYCLRITDVDPIELNLYFERFLNPERTSPPDFDIDFSWTDRDDIMDYIFKRYGKNHVALLGSYTTFQHDAIIMELGKVFGLPVEEIKSLQRATQPTDKIQRTILQYGSLLKNFPNNISIHPCGMLVTEKPMFEYAALFMPPKGFATTQMDMFVAENIGINKFDILSQRGLGHIKESLRLIKANKGIDVNIHDFQNFRHNTAIKKQIREAETIGCFYIESPAMRQLLKKLRCDDYITLVAASSIIRPGVAQSGMMREYITRFHNRDKVTYLHPLFEEHLSETFGVMVFQEDVIKIAHYFAGLSLGEADILRRAMSGKYRSNNKFRHIKEKYLSNCRELGHTDELAHEVWRQMESFAGYSFNKAHSASFAVESYMSLYLKTFFPKEFMVAVINNFGGFYSTELYFIELMKAGGIINAPCINNSDIYTSIKGDEVYTGFIHIKALQERSMQQIIEERKEGGVFLHLQDFIERTDIGLEQLNILVSIGAFRFTGKTKKQLLWEANFLQKKNKTHIPVSDSLFEEKPIEFTLPALTDNAIDDLYDQKEILGFTLSSPFAMVDEDPDKYLPAKDIGKHLHKVVTVLVYFIAKKHVQTKNNDVMFFGTFIDKDLDWVDTVHFPDAARTYPMHSGGFYKVTGRVVDDFGVYSIEARKMIKVGFKKRSYDTIK
ncbi:DNA polymerase III subunit alpha [Niastella caeni]|uniref:DNA polymerase III subunit alpha n=1 Tax=Niastella caeni TaxID=2569763 RepID=A0A4V4H1B7_9BACT|nr:DNA polymerase III subunit alpha [Niastella caeni]THU39866.1 DNA polymerase III subunit alpha [Niastella caeni]